MNKNSIKTNLYKLINDLVAKKKITYSDYYIIKDYVKLLEQILQNDNKIINNLSKENKRLSKEDEEIRNKNCFLVNGFHELEERINKTIEMLDNDIFRNNYYTLDFEFKFKEYREDIKNILLGSED